jgi:hypothetical protein
MITDCPPKLTEFICRLTEMGLSAEETVNNQGENPSRRFDLESKSSLGRIVFWNSDEWELEAISVKTGELVFWISLNQPEDLELSEALAILESHMK